MSDERYLLKAEEIAELQPSVTRHPLNPKAIRSGKSLGGLCGLTGFGIHEVRIAPGDETTESHVQICEDECLYLLEGVATAFIGDEQFNVSAGDFIAYPKAGLDHKLRNSGHEPLSYLMVGQRLATEVVDYPKIGKRLFRMEGLAKTLSDLSAFEAMGEPIKKPDIDPRSYILTKAQIAGMPGTHKVHFLNDRAVRLNWSLGDKTGLTGLGVHIIDVEPGFETTEYHRHYYEDECIYVLAGEATAFVGDQKHAIGPGDFLGHKAGGLPHSITNTGNQTLRCLVIGQRLDHDVSDYPRLNKRIFRNKGMDWVTADISDLTTVGGSVGKK